MTPYYADNFATIYHGLAEVVLPSIVETFDLGLTDPPYNFGFDYGNGHDDSRTPDAYRNWCASWFGELRRISGRVVVFPGHGNLPTWWSIEKPSGVGCWYKPGNPARGGVFQFCEWEPWLLWGGRRWGGSDVIRAPVSEQQDTGDHPCPKPVTLFGTIIKRTKALSVIDPFVGSGTTLVAAKLSGVRCLGIEQNERFCEIAANRCRQGVLFGANQQTEGSLT